MNLRDLPTFTNASQSFFETLEKESQTVRHGKGKILFLHEDEAASFFLIKSGWVKLFRETLDGSQSVVDILPAGHIFGETAIFENDRYPYSGEVVEPAEIVSLPLSALKAEIRENNDFAFSMMSAMARYRRQQDRELEHRTIQNAPQRIGCFLLRLADQSKTGPVTIHLPYDKTLVASRLGMQPETFSRALSKLKSQTGITIKGATIEMDSLNQLVEFSCAACSSEFPCKDLTAKKA
ncbi:MAG: Crp/Fnr family transcriptional regulator [Alphaproteobacteria bacterium]|nr:Crp/Fnr family transcriptional regulator [Alphaproteobacteria bacterium]